ncbi:glycosyltransferase family 2 protein [Streptomyces africanus]|uniref:glycosyltransferase family 2 protein n=1 Tax=Streptomyces africanus TaxID=231024 RepID=UPI0013026276|nr:glycosyltransferase family A protein [Streptomyces africanus]
MTVAVVVPTIPGREAMLERALASVRAQRRRPDQVVVERDSLRTGADQARNRALERVTTDVVAWLDDDDELKPNHLMACMRVMEQSSEKPDLVYPAPVVRGGEDPTAVSVQGRWVLPWGVRFGPEQETHLRRFGSFIPMTHVVRTERVRAIGGFRPGEEVTTEGLGRRYRGEDEDYLVRLLDIGATFEHLSARTWVWHVHRGNTAGRALAR